MKSPIRKKQRWGVACDRERQRDVLLFGAFTVKDSSFTFVGPDNIATPLPTLPKANLKFSDPYLSSH
jgi:hypothetical protein